MNYLYLNLKVLNHMSSYFGNHNHPTHLLSQGSSRCSSWRPNHLPLRAAPSPLLKLQWSHWNHDFSPIPATWKNHHQRDFHPSETKLPSESNSNKDHFNWSLQCFKDESDKPNQKRTSWKSEKLHTIFNL